MGIGLDLAGRRKDGREFPVEISLSPVTTADGPLVFATVVDITARKSAEQELLQAQKMESIGRLAGGIAHDFDNMLSAIRGFAELLHDDLELDPLPPLGELQHSVEAVRGAADRAAMLPPSCWPSRVVRSWRRLPSTWPSPCGRWSRCCGASSGSRLSLR